MGLQACFLAALLGCGRHGEDVANAPDASAIAATPTVPAPSATPSASPSGATFGLALAGRLAREAASRPSDTPKAEDVLAAIAKSGVPLQEQAQHLASPIGALYCIGAKSPLELAMSACEYADETAAGAGRDSSVKAFAKIEHRDVVVNKKTTLTILQSPYDPQSQAAHDKAVAAFKKM